MCENEQKGAYFGRRHQLPLLFYKNRLKLPLLFVKIDENYPCYFTKSTSIALVICQTVNSHGNLLILRM